MTIPKKTPTAEDYLIRIEAINFDHILEDTEQLSVRRGASIALHHAIAKVLEENKNLEAIRLGGSIGIFKVETDEIKNLIKNIQSLLKQDDLIEFLPSLPFAVQYTSYTPGDNNSEQQALKQLETQCHLEQLQCPALTLPTASAMKVISPANWMRCCRNQLLSLTLHRANGYPTFLPSVLIMGVSRNTVL